MIFCSYFFKASRTNALNINDILNSVVTSTRYKTGCISSEIWNDRSVPGSTLLLEQWESSDYLFSHFSSVAFRRVLSAMELCSEKPTVKFIDSEDVKDINWLEHVFFMNLNRYQNQEVVPKQF
jgi:quinol monooxygenase YgiN